MGNTEIIIFTAVVFESCRNIKVNSKVAAAHYLNEFVSAFIGISRVNAQYLVGSVVGIKGIHVSIVEDDAVNMVLYYRIRKSSSDKDRSVNKRKQEQQEAAE